MDVIRQEVSAWLPNSTSSHKPFSRGALMQLSYNKLKTFGECALKYRLAYVERLPRPPVASLAFHRRLHAALGQYHLFAKRDGIVREEDLLAAYATIWDAGRDPSVRETKLYQEGEEILRRYCEVENGKGRVPAQLEHTIRFAFGPYELTGKIDRLDFCDSGRFSIVDYKLDRKLPGENAAETDRQLSFYHLLVEEGLGRSVEDVRLYFLRHGVEQVSCRTRAQLRETVAWVDETATAIHLEKQWEPKEGGGCRTCAFADQCPAKTGQARRSAPVWQQGDLLWELTQAPSSPEAEVLPAAASAARQTTLDF
jgi:DNA helicase-2/ATP-dependent DNA helicase PcrA